MAFALGAALCASAAPDAAVSDASAAPSAVALDDAREEVRKMLAGDFRALNSGRKSLVQVADHVADLSAASDSAAAVRVLQEGAFNMYRAADALARAAERRVPFWINLGSDAEFEFVACPAGSFKMGLQGDPAEVDFRHKVTITRPFWIARFQTTKRLYDTFRKVWFNDEEKLYGGMDVPMGGIPRSDIEGFCAFLMRQNRDRVPEGYVFRLPTDAEWEYALNANCEDPDDPYVRFKSGDGSVAGDIAITRAFVDDFRVAHGQSRGNPKVWGGPGFAVGKKRPNAWGLYDMLSNGAEMVLDTIPSDAVKIEYGEGEIGRGYNMGYRDEETDPLRFAGGSNVLFVFRGRGRWDCFKPSWQSRVVRRGVEKWERELVFRIVLAPDLLAERAEKGDGK